jgi:hypothetical protein
VAGQVSTNGGEKLVSEPLITGKNPPPVKLSHESQVSTTRTDVDDTLHGCSVTPSWLIAVVAAPRHRPESTPYGAYSISKRRVIRESRVQAYAGDGAAVAAAVQVNPI